MEINKDKKQRIEEAEKFFLAPSPRPFLGVTLKEDTDIEDEFELVSEDGTQTKKVQQTIKGNVFITEIKYSQKINEEMWMKQESREEYHLPLGARLVWEEGQGYIACEDKFQTIEEIQEMYKELKEI